MLLLMRCSACGGGSRNNFLRPLMCYLLGVNLEMNHFRDGEFSAGAVAVAVMKLH